MNRPATRHATCPLDHLGPWSAMRSRALCPSAAVIVLGVLGLFGALAEHAYAQPSCAPIAFAQGEITTGQPLATTMPLTDATKACLTAIAEAAAKRPDLRTVTVVVRLPDAERQKGEALAAAQTMSDVLQAAGLPRRKLSVVAPAIGHSQTAGVQFLYSERGQGRVVAKLTIVKGTVSTGASTAALSAAAQGATLRVSDYLATAARSHATLALADGSLLHVRPDTLLRLGKVALTADYERQVEIEVLTGSARVEAVQAKTGSTFQVISRAAVAGVRGTEFRFVAPSDDTTRLEALSGDVSLGNTSGQQDVSAGHGSRATAGSAPEAPRPLLAPPTRMTPIQGQFATAPTISWEPAAGAASYIIELARNAKFTREVTWLESDSPSATFEPLADGRWFWRVLAVDADGFVGMPSKIYSFVIDPAAAPEATPPVP